ncbi:MAG: argininosuccinate lyase [Candidatus Omnitrophica bacterium]|nr:argininosuccinate lyase [Candidatus Omnitrophota bacterium]
MKQKLWGGRFTAETDSDFYRFQQSIQYDHLLAEYDVMHSLLHIEALRSAKLLDTDEYTRLSRALRVILGEIGEGTYRFGKDAEDIHTDIQQRVAKIAGRAAAAKLHTLRSRNDQIQFDEKSYCVKEAITLLELTSKVLEQYSLLIQKFSGEYFIGFTHLQRAQVILASDYFGAYFWLFHADFVRLDRYVRNAAVSIGNGALAGSALDKNDYIAAVKKLLPENMWKIIPTANAIYGVSDRDYLIELLSICALIQSHLSRFAEDCVVYSSREFGYFRLPEQFCTGSSLMPQKKNPDFFELVRGTTGKIYGNLMSALTVMKGLPLAYNRDMQLNKESLFSSVTAISEQMKLLAKAVPGIEIDHARVHEALADEGLYATELAEYLVQEKVPFQRAHEIVGKLISESEKRKTALHDFSEAQLKKFHEKITRTVITRVMNPEYAVRSRNSVSNTLPGKK